MKFLLIIFYTIILYLAGAFIALELNVTHWQGGGRFLMTAFWILGIIIILNSDE